MMKAARAVLGVSLLEARDDQTRHRMASIPPPPPVKRLPGSVRIATGVETRVVARSGRDAT
jgi:hypothetical protein